MKECSGCKEHKSLSEFPIRKDRSNKLRPYCKECDKDIKRARYNNHKITNPFLHKCTRAKSRASYLKVPFDLDKDYLESIWTGICPVMGVPLDMSASRDSENAPELDRFKPALGYVKGNVTFLSRKANRLKNSASVPELRNLITWMEKYESSIDR